MTRRERARRNPFDAGPLAAARVPMSAIVALTELDAAGVPLVQHGAYVLVDRDAAAAARLAGVADRARELSPYVLPVSATKLAGTTKDIVDALTRTFFVMGWMSYRDYQGRADPFDVAPKRMPRRVREFAHSYVARFEVANGAPIGVVYAIAASAPGKHYRAPRPDEFGYDIAMKAMGHGISWEDNHPDAGMKVPHDEWYY